MSNPACWPKLLALLQGSRTDRYHSLSTARPGFRPPVGGSSRILIQFRDRPMNMRFTILAGVTLLLGIASSSRAQMETPKPAPELKKLDYFAGTWSAEGDIKP